MKFLKKFFKNLKSEKGLTGADVAAAVMVIVLAISIVTSIFINVTNKSKENIRYSNGVRIATQIVENIEIMPFDYFINYIGNTNSQKIEATYGKVEKAFDNTDYSVNVPKGYTAEIRLSAAQNFDVIRDVTVIVTYKLGTKTKTITLYTQKEKELLEQTNRPDLTKLDVGLKTAYPIKKVGDKYIVTNENDPEWYNYAKGYYALVFISVPNAYAVGSEIPSGELESNGDVYAWIPRCGIDIVDDKEVLRYCYGTSNWKILFVEWDDTKGNKLHAYSLTGENIKNDGKPDTIEQYPTYIVNSWNDPDPVFSDGDGLTGVWCGSESRYFRNGWIFDTLQKYNKCQNYKFRE